MAEVDTCLPPEGEQCTLVESNEQTQAKQDECSTIEPSPPVAEVTPEVSTAAVAEVEQSTAPQAKQDECSTAEPSPPVAEVTPEVSTAAVAEVEAKQDECSTIEPSPPVAEVTPEVSTTAVAEVAPITVESSPEEAASRLEQLVIDAKTQDLPPASPDPSSSLAEGDLPLFQPVRYLRMQVHPELGAGLSLRPTLWGMLVEDVEPNPGQPGLEKGDYIVEIAKKKLVNLDETTCKQVFGSTFGDGIEIGAATPVEEPKRKDTSESLLGGSWPEAVQAEAGGQWPEATEIQATGTGTRSRASTAPTGGYPASSVGSVAPEPAGGLLDLVAQLSQQLANETLRRDAEEAELEERRRDEKRLREELQAKRQRRSDVLAAAEAAKEAAEETRRQHAELAETHERTKAEVEEHEHELSELRAAAKARTGRDWARDGPEKDELVKTKLSIAEAHDRLAHVRLQLRLNRDGLRLQLRTLQEENDRLRGSLSSSTTRA